MKNYEIYYGISKSYNPKNHLELLNFKFSNNLKRSFSYLKNNDESSITCSELGYSNITRNQANLKETGISAAKRHTKNDQNFFSENVYILELFVKYAIENGINIVFFTSPAYFTYTDNLNRQQLEKTLITIEKIVSMNPHCSYYNFLNDRDFDASHFQDADHLNQNGARLLSNKLNVILSN
ncbi:MAG: hypothetical protein ACJA2C_000759 [Marinoscillum sp.]